MDDLLLVGLVAAPFGVRGLLKVKAFTDRPDYIARHARTIYLKIEDRLAPYPLAQLYEHKPGILIMALRGVQDRDQADALRGAELYVQSSDAAPLEEGEYFLHQLVGLNVTTVDGEQVGAVREVLSSGAGETLLITRPGQPDAMVPMVRAFIAHLDLEAHQVVIRPIEGLLA